MHRPDGIPAGAAPLVTPGHALPCKHILHVTGPMVPDHRPTQTQQDQLRSCYSGCLDAAKANGLKSVAFCCISTGLFGYPQQEAAQVALATVSEWLAQPYNKGILDKVVFVTFLQADHAIYQQLLAQ